MKKRTKRIVWVVIILAVVGGAVVYLSTREPEVTFTTETASRADVVKTISVTGKVRPTKEVPLSFEVGGKISHILVEVGEKITQGQKIASLDDSVIRSQVREALWALEIQEQNLKLARRKWDELKPEEKESRKAAVEQVRTSAQTMIKQLAKTDLLSPVSGTVSGKNFEQGMVVAQTQPIIAVFTEGDFEIEADVPESDIAAVEVGQRAVVTFDAFDASEEFEAEVVKIDPASTDVQGVVFYKITLRVEQDDRLKPGMTADADIHVSRKENVVAVPRRSVRQEDSRQYVEVLVDREKGATERVEVVTGLEGDEGNVEIVSGLDGGEEVVILRSES